MILSNIKPRCRFQGWEERVCQIVSFPCCNSAIRFVFNPVPQLLYSFTKKQQHCDSKTNDGTAVVDRDGTKRALKPLFELFGEPGIQQKQWHHPQKLCGTRSLVPGRVLFLTQGLRDSGSKEASFFTMTRDLQGPPLPRSHPGYTTSSGKLTKASSPGDLESVRLHQGLVLR